MKRIFVVIMVLLMAGVASNVYGADRFDDPRFGRPTCTGSLGLSMEISPKEIAARKNKSVDITVTGSVTIPRGCGLLSLTYTFEDEYGEIGSDEPQNVELSGGSFTITEKVKVSRKGEDKDGRSYTITVTATDIMRRTVSEGFVVTVAHDNRGGNSDAKGDNGNGEANGKGNGNGPDTNNGQGKAKGKDK